jgi:hypothetical protein
MTLEGPTEAEPALAHKVSFGQQRIIFSIKRKAAAGRLPSNGDADQCAAE